VIGLIKLLNVFFNELYLGYRILIIISFNTLTWIIHTAPDLTFSLKLQTFLNNSRKLEIGTER
jgi:hypothetical protein